MEVSIGHHIVQGVTGAAAGAVPASRCCSQQAAAAAAVAAASCMTMTGSPFFPTHDFSCPSLPSPRQHVLLLHAQLEGVNHLLQLLPLRVALHQVRLRWLAEVDN